ncbi:MBL fold metallo-hydrolase [Bosea thiooxidans]
MDRRAFLSTTAMLAAAAITPGSGRAAAPAKRSQASGFRRLDLGGVEITALLDGTLPVPLDQVYAGMEPTDVRTSVADAFLPSPTELSVNAYLVNTDDRLVLINAGTGDFLGSEVGHLPAAIAAAGYSPGDIDAVILTHVHVDHSGGLVKDGRPVFPNAVVHTNEREIGYWLNDKNKRSASDRHRRTFDEAATSLGPYAVHDRLRGFADGAAPLPGFGSILLPGHTPGHSAVTIERGGSKLAIWGDITHGHVVQFARPDVTIAFDLDPEQAHRSRMKAFGEAAAGRYWVAGAHVPFPGVGHVRRIGDAFDWVPMNYTTRGVL